MAINQASVLVGDLRSFKMWDNKASASINPMVGKRCTSSQLRFIALKSFKEMARTKATAYFLFLIHAFFNQKNARSNRVNQGVQLW
jgi:hypothetical protein